MFKKKQPPPPPKEDERIVAKRKLVALLRSKPTTFRALALPMTVEDHVLVQALTKFDSPFHIVRECGYSLRDATLVGKLLPLALQAPIEMMQTRREEQPDKKFERALKPIAGCCVLVLFFLMGVLVWTITQSASGWKQGTCSITIFSGQTCVQSAGQCKVEVSVQGEGEWLTQRGWSLPIAYTRGLGGVPLTQYDGEALRCCNTNIANKESVVGTCCDLYDVQSQQFCDNWVHTKDHFGNPCPKNYWHCIYQIDPIEEGHVKELKPYVPPDITPLLASMAVIVGFLLISVASVLARKACIEIKCCKKLSSRLEGLFLEEEEETPVNTHLEDLENGPQPLTASEQDAQFEKRSSTSRSQRPQKSETSASIAEFNETPPEKDFSSANSKRRSSTISGSSRQSGATSYSSSSKRPSSACSKRPSSACSKRRELTSETDLASLPGVVEEPQAELLNGQSGAESDVTKYISWTSLGKQLHELVEDDMHDSFKLGDLSQLTAKAARASRETKPALIEPLGKRTPPHQRHGQSKRGNSSNRQQSRPHSAGNSLNRKQIRPHSAGAPTTWAWDGQRAASFEGKHVLDASRHRSVSSGRTDRNQDRPKSSHSRRAAQPAFLT